MKSKYAFSVFFPVFLFFYLVPPKLMETGHDQNTVGEADYFCSDPITCYLPSYVTVNPDVACEEDDSCITFSTGALPPFYLPSGCSARYDWEVFKNGSLVATISTSWPSLQYCGDDNGGVYYDLDARVRIYNCRCYSRWRGGDTAVILPPGEGPCN